MKTTKRCPRCGIEKSRDDFHKCKIMRDGLQVQCIACRKIIMRIWREKNVERMKQSGKEYRAAHREERREYNRRWRYEHRDYWRGYQNERLQMDLNYRLHNYISAAIRKGIRKNRRSTLNLLGYSIDELRQHLESLFQPGMSWQNYGTAWHIDHVIPKSWFEVETADGVDEYEMKACWSLRNLQPLSAAENLQKKDRHISHMELGELRITYEQFRIVIERQKREPAALPFSFYKDHHEVIRKGQISHVE